MTATSVEPERPIYHSSVMLDDGEYRAFLLLHYDRIVLVALRINQTDRIRNYSWRYDQIKKVVQIDLNEQRRHTLYFYTDVSDDQNPAFEVNFVCRIERDQFAFRIKTLAKIYNQKVVRKSNQINQVTNQNGLEDEFPSPSLDTADVDTATPIVSYGMFSPENLKILAASSQNSTSSESEGPVVEAKGYVGSDGNFVIPIEVNVDGLDCSLSASAKLRLKLSVDTQALAEAGNIRNRADRIRRIQELVKLEAPVCELVIS